jgi:hypothetical protein
MVATAWKWIWRVGRLALLELNLARAGSAQEPKLGEETDEED